MGKFLDLLNPNRAAIAANGPLRSIFTLIELEGDKADSGYLRAVPLDLEEDGKGDWRWMPIGLAEAHTDDRVALHRLFVAADVPQGDFIRFFYLMRKYATTLPNTYGEPGVSLFEQWKMVAALAGSSEPLRNRRTGPRAGRRRHSGHPADDQPVTANGAAKAMRGRSAFIQLLGYALVERLLDELNLGPANVIYDAGGNFVLLTGWVDGADGTEAKAKSVSNKVNRVCWPAPKRERRALRRIPRGPGGGAGRGPDSCRDPGRSWPGGRPIGMATGRKTDQGRGCRGQKQAFRRSGAGIC